MKPIVFVITPFGESFLELFSEMKSWFREKYEFINAGDMDNQQNILKDIVTGISDADIVIADLTGNNPNVFYELGLAHAMNKKVIIITQDIDELPFDIRSYRAYQYSMLFYKLPELKEELKKNLDGAIDGTVGYGNPVFDFLPNYNPRQGKPTDDTAVISKSDNHEINPVKEDEEAGILDYIDDIQKCSEELLNEINCMGEEMKSMNEGVEKASSEIDRVNSQSKGLDLSFAKKICRKLAQPMDVYATKLNEHVTVILDKWDSMENSYLLMLDSDILSSSENKKGIEDSVVSLKEMQQSIQKTDKQYESFISMINQVKGYERTLNKAANSLISALERYLQTTGKMSASIDRIISKSKVVLGD